MGVLKNPINYSYRVTAIKWKIFNATGIQPHLQDIQSIQISTKRVKLCWISFGSERTVAEIFRLSMINGSSKEFNVFPHIPGKAMSKKEGIERIMKRIQAINQQLRYQVRMGENDLILKIKYQYKDDYRPYVSVDIKDIDPNDPIPDWELVMSSRKTIPETPKAGPFDWQKAGKRNASRSPEDRSSKRSNREDIDDWQIAEFIHEFLEGTRTKPRYKNLDWQAVVAAARREDEIEEHGAAPPQASLEAVPPHAHHGAAPPQTDQAAANPTSDLSK